MTMNKAILVGRLTKDPEIRYTQSGKAVGNFTLAVDRGYRGYGDKKETDFIPIVVWGKVAETCGNYLTKGQKVLIDGHIRVDNYEKDGQKRWRTMVVANRVEFLERKKDQPGGNIDDIAASMGEEIQF